jgi:hypothetical protein
LRAEVERLRIREEGLQARIVIAEGIIKLLRVKAACRENAERGVDVLLALLREVLPFATEQRLWEANEKIDELSDMLSTVFKDGREK